MTGLSVESGKNQWFGNFSNHKLDTRLPTKKIRRLDFDAFSEERKVFKSQIHLIVISKDC